MRSGRRNIDVWRRGQYGVSSGLPRAPFAGDLIHAWYADREIALATGEAGWGDAVGTTDFAQADTTKQPAYGLFTTKPALVFDGVNDFMASPVIALSSYTSLTYALTFQFTGGTTKVVYETDAALANPGNLVFFETNGVSCTLGWRNAAANVALAVGGAMVPGTVYRLIFVVNANAAQAFSAVYLNNASQGVSAASNVGFANSIHYIGMRAGTSLPWPGKLGTMLMYGRALTVAEIGVVDAYLATGAV